MPQTVQDREVLKEYINLLANDKTRTNRTKKLNQSCPIQPVRGRDIHSIKKLIDNRNCVELGAHTNVHIHIHIVTPGLSYTIRVLISDILIVDQLLPLLSRQKNRESNNAN